MTDTEQKKIFSKNLLRLLSLNDKTQKEVAGAIGASPQTFNTWCQGIALPRMGKVQRLADYFGVPKSELIDEYKPFTAEDSTEHKTKMVKIPIVGTVAAGVPISAIEDIQGYEEIPEQLARTGEFYALRIKGDSMSPDIRNGDVVIVRVQPVADNNDIVIASVNGDEATCKRLKRYETELCLVPINPDYETMRFTPQEVNTLPVSVLGKVIELRRKYE